MKYIFCIVLPPLAVLLKGKISAFLLCIILTSIFWVPGVVYAMWITKKYFDEKREDELLKALW